MLPFGITGKLKTLVNRLTSTWAAKLDTLHDTRLTSTWAAKLDDLRTGLTDARMGYMDKLNITGTVPSGSDWTSARAGYIDKINNGGIPGTVKSVQHFYTYIGGTSVTETILSVNTSKSIIILRGTEADGITTMDAMFAALQFASSTSVSISRASSEGGLYVSFSVVEYY